MFRNNFLRNIFILFIIITFAGALRKWIIDNSVINLLLTILGTTSLFLFWYVQKKDNQNIIGKEVSTMLFAFTFYLTACAFNPLNHTFYHGIVGIIIHLGFWIVIFLYLYNTNKYDLSKFNNIIIVISVIQVAIACIQYTSPSDSTWNVLRGNSSMAVSSDAIANDSVELDGDSYSNSAFVGDGTRATGTFSYLGGYYAYMIFHMLFTFSLFIRKSPSYLSVSMLFMGFLGCILNGSRSLIIVYLTINFAFFCFQLSNRKALFQAFAILMIFFAFNSAFNDFLGVQKFTQNAVTNLSNRALRSEEENRTRINGPIESLFNYDGEYPIFGVGVGATYSGINSIFGASKYVTKHAYEHEIGRTIQDGGYILLLFKIILYILLIKRLSLNKIFSTVIFLILFFGTLITTNPYLSFYLLFGLLFINQSIIDFKETSEK